MFLSNTISPQEFKVSHKMSSTPVRIPPKMYKVYPPICQLTPPPPPKKRKNCCILDQMYTHPYPLTPKFTSWKKPFQGIDHVAHFLMSPLTLRPLHGGQTSQGKCAWVAPSFNDSHESQGGRDRGYQKWRYAQSS